jgi:hypothetical protein
VVVGEAQEVQEALGTSPPVYVGPYARGIGRVLVVLGGAVLISLALDLPSVRGVVGGLETIKANAAVSFVLLGLALVWRDALDARARRMGGRGVAKALCRPRR